MFSKHIGKIIHWGTKEFVPSKFKDIQNRKSVKPKGGLWCSPFNSDYGWIDFCKDIEIRNYKDDNFIKLKLFNDAKILTIDSYEDLENIHKKYDNTPIPEDKDLFLDYGFYYLDYEKISKDYDVIWLTHDGLLDTHSSHPYNLYTWDCETVLILNKNCFEIIKV